MRVIVHDYVGHPFQVQLSRGLAQRGHEVLHLYSASYQTPQGDLKPGPGDAPTFNVRAIKLPEEIQKYSFFQRYAMEKQYARQLIDQCEQFNPDVVLSANSPSIVQHRLAKLCRQRGVRLVSWIQDMYGVAAYRILKKKMPLVGHLIGQYFMMLDRQSARMSDQVVVITEDFVPLVESWGIAPRRIHAVHNWAPIDDLPVGSRDNQWATSQGLAAGVRFVYAGTLSIRHNPDLLLQLAHKLDQFGDGQLVVISEGSGIEWLSERAREQNVRSLRCLGFQPFDQMANVFASADVLVAILEPDAGVFCVPSKVLSYMCARRALLIAIPKDNLAARIVQRNKAGLVAGPEEMDEFLDAARRLYEDSGLRAACGQAAREYAEEHFDFAAICDRFSEILGLRNSPVDAVVSRN